MEKSEVRPHLLVIFEDHTVCDREGAALRPEVAL